MVNYMTQILVALLALANLIVAVTKATASGARLNEIFDTQTTLIEKESQEQHPKASENRVVFEKVTFTYAGAGAPALEDISFVAEVRGDDRDNWWDGKRKDHFDSPDS